MMMKEMNARWDWKPHGMSGIYFETNQGRYVVEKTRRRKPQFVARLNGQLIAIRDSEDAAILAAKEDAEGIKAT